MTEPREREFADVLERSGTGWRAQDGPSAGRLLEHLEKAAEEYNSRFQARVDLLAACNAMPEKMRAFLQAIMYGVSPGLLAMVARILLREASVVRLRLDVVSHRSAELHIEIKDPDVGETTFDSTDIWDAEVIRHFGLMQLGDKPIIAGYYASQVP